MSVTVWTFPRTNLSRAITVQICQVATGPNKPMFQRLLPGIHPSIVDTVRAAPHNPIIVVFFEFGILFRVFVIEWPGTTDDIHFFCVSDFFIVVGGVRVSRFLWKPPGAPRACRWPRHPPVVPSHGPWA